MPTTQYSLCPPHNIQVAKYIYITAIDLIALDYEGNTSFLYGYKEDN